MEELIAAKKIRAPYWMREKETLIIMNALNDDGAQLQTLFVGGCVRNALLAEPVEDIDLASKLTPDEVTRRLQAAGVRVIPTGIDHGTVTAHINGRNFEVTTLRRDVETDGRRAVIAYSSSWLEDAQRRDFTMNTLLADLDGNIYDPLGLGLRDLEARKVVFVGEPEQRIVEDTLRILRFFRFHALYGVGEPNEDALKACREASNRISSLSSERITQEFFKILSVDKSVDVLRIMRDNNILPPLIHAEAPLELLGHFCAFQKRYGLISLPSRLFILNRLDKKSIDTELLLIPKVFLRDINAIDQVLLLPDLDKDQAIREAVYRCGRVATAQALIIEFVQDRVMNGYAPQALKIIQNWDIPDCPVDGAELIKAGMKPGPELGKALTQLENAWIASDFQQNKEELLASIVHLIN